MTGNTREPSLIELNARVERLEGLVERLVQAFPECASVSKNQAAPQATEPPSTTDQRPVVQASRAVATGATHTESSITDSHGVHTTPPPGSAKFLGTVGVLCFILAGSYFVKLAISEGWVTPAMQLMALVAFALFLILAGFVLRDSDTQYASLLPGTGVVLLYMAGYGGHLYFDLYDTSTANLVVNGVSVVALVLYASFRQHFYALAASVGTYLVPLLLGSATWTFVPLCIYVMVWNVTFSFIAASLGSRLLLGLTAYLAVLLVGLVGEQSAGSDLHAERFNVAIFQALQFLFFCVMIARYSIRRREPLSNSEAWAFFPLLLLFYLAEYELIFGLNARVAPWCALGFGCWVYAVYEFAKRRFGPGALESYPMVSCFLAVTAVHAVYVELSPPSLRPWLAIAVIGYYARYVGASLRSSPHRATILVLSLIPLIEYTRTLLDFGHPYSPAHTTLLNFAFAGMLLFAAREAKAIQSSTSLPLGILGAAQLLLGFKHLSLLWFEPITAAYVTSALWSATALVLLVFAQRLNDRALASMASWLFGLTAVKLLRFDLSESGTGGRIVALLVIGALFYAGGYVYRRIAT